MDAKLFAKQHDRVPGLPHGIVNGSAHFRAAAFYVIEAAPGRFRGIGKSGLKGRCFCLKINAKVPKQAEPLGSPFPSCYLQDWFLRPWASV
jgi:hypothetical protein